MSANSSELKSCITCNKAGGVLMCDGCKQTFCYKHVIEHRQHLTLQLETIMQEHDCLQQDLALQKEYHPAFEEIDQWEKKTIERIQTVAGKVREELRDNLEKNNERASRICREIADVLRSAREAENFSENELTQWTEQLNEVRSQMKIQLTVEIPLEDNNNSIHLIRLKEKTMIESTPCSVIQERFSEVYGLAIIEDDGLQITNNDHDMQFIYSRGREVYSVDRHTIKFKAEQCSGSGNLFIGICASNIGLRQIMYQFSAVIGWFSNYQTWQYHSNDTNIRLEDQNEDIKTGDIFELTLDCERRQIELFCKRTNVRQVLNVNCERTPLPWYFLLGIRRKNDCVRIVE